MIHTRCQKFLLFVSFAPRQASSDNREKQVKRKLMGYVGFANRERLL
jgi:hypothetical protein